MEALAFSGGKDSLACWLLARDRDPHVIWVNTGKTYPETRGVVDYVRTRSKNFHEVRTDQARQNAEHGIPTELLAVDCTLFGGQFVRPRGARVQSYLNCCLQNIGMPLHHKAKVLGCDILIRGQRNDEWHRSTARDGTVLDGITYRQPIEDWTSQQVIDFIARHMPVPGHFVLEHSSMDCYDCTAFLEHSIDRAAWSKARHPELHAQHIARLRDLRAGLEPGLRALDTILGDA